LSCNEASTEDDFGSAIVARAYKVGMIFVIECGATEINESYFGVL